MARYELVKDEHMGWRTYRVYIFSSSESIAGITEETGEEAVERFTKIVSIREFEVVKAHSEYLERRQWNYDHPGQGKEWPAMKHWSKLLNNLLKEAGIKDS